MRKLLALALTFALAFPATAAARGRLDPSFGDGGRVVRATALDGSAYGPGSKAAVAPDGHVYALVNERTVLAFEQNGRVDSDFGTGGAVDVLPAGEVGRGPLSIAVDRRGRILVATTVSPQEAFDPGAEYEPEPVPEPQQAILVARFTASGQPDSSFGEEGRLVTRLGFLPPEVPANSIFGPGSPRHARVAASGIAVDSDGRIVLSGTYLAGYAICSGDGTYRPQREAFIARLGDDGRRDPGFRGGGVALLREGPVGPPATDERGGIYASVGAPTSCEVADRESIGYLFHLDPTGKLVEGWGKGGWRTIPEDTFLRLLPDGDGLILLPQTGQWRNNLSVRRLRGDGSWDRGFGRRGVAIPFPYPRGTLNLTDAAVGGDGHVYVTGNWKRKRRGGGANQRFLLFRLDRRGRLDRRYGVLRTGFGKGTMALSRHLLMTPSGSPLALGPIKDPLAGYEGLALARYLP